MTDEDRPGAGEGAGTHHEPSDEVSGRGPESAAEAASAGDTVASVALVDDFEVLPDDLTSARLRRLVAEADDLETKAKSAHRDVQEAATATVEARAAHLYLRVQARSVDLDAARQKKLADLLALTPDIAASGDLQMMSLLEVAADSVMRQPPNDQMTDTIHKNLEKRLLDPTAYVVGGLIAAFVVLIALPILFVIIVDPKPASATGQSPVRAPVAAAGPTLSEVVAELKRRGLAVVVASPTPSAAPLPSPAPSISPSPQPSPSAMPSDDPASSTDLSAAAAPRASPDPSPMAVAAPTPGPSAAGAMATPSLSPSAQPSPVPSPSPAPVVAVITDDAITQLAASDEFRFELTRACPQSSEEAAGGVGGDAPSCFLGLPVQTLLLVAIFGAAGALASLMVRIRTFSLVRGRSKLEMFLVGFTRPILGILFAMFIYVVIGAGLIPLVVAQPSFFWAAVAFVAGFSERFAPDVASRTESTILGGVKVGDAHR